MYNIPDWRGTKIANARVFFNSEIKDEDNLLYLDSDTFVVDKLDDLEKYNGPINMVLDVMPQNKINEMNLNTKYYCNSGVLWINMKKWNELDCDKKIVDTLKGNIKFTYPDQDLLNIALKDDIHLLPPNYNLFTTDYYYSLPFLLMYYKQTDIKRYSFKEIIDAKKNPIILHGTPLSFMKDYTIDTSIHPYNDLYNKFLNEINIENKNEKINIIEKIIIDTILHTKVLFPKEIREKIKKLVKK